MANDPFNDPNAEGQVYGFRIDKATWGGNVLASPSYGDPEVKKILFGGAKIGRAFAGSLDPIVLKIALHKHLRQDLVAAAMAIAETFVLVIKVTAGAIVVGVAAGGIIGVLYPPAGLALIRGAQVGITIATRLGPWILGRLGLCVTVMGAAPCFREAGERFNTGIQMALADSEDIAGICIAEGYAIILSYVLIGIATELITRGIGRFRFGMGGGKLTAWVKGLPKPVDNLAAATRIVGKTEGELRYMMQESRGKLLIERGGNPDRLNWKGRDVDSKGMNIKSHTLPSGARNAGAVGWDARNMAEFEQFQRDLLMKYKLEPSLRPNGSPINGEFTIVSKTPHTPAATKPGHMPTTQMDPLDGYKIYHSPEGEVLILNKQGKPIVGDIDRLMSYEINKFGAKPMGYNTGPKGYFPNDAVAEVEKKNAGYRKGVAPSERVGDTPYKHGESGRYGKVTFDRYGEPHFEAGYPKKGPDGAYIVNNEPLLVALDGKLYILKDWHQLRAFCLANGQHGLHFPWEKIVQSDHKV